MSFTGSISDNRIYLALPPIVRQALYDDARALGIKTAEFHRQLLIRFYWRVVEQHTSARVPEREERE